MTAEAFRQSVMVAFPMLPGIFGTGIGLYLQREDSDMAEQIMLHFAEKDVPVLPVHDSFIIAAQHKDELVRVKYLRCSCKRNSAKQRPSASSGHPAGRSRSRSSAKRVEAGQLNTCLRGLYRGAFFRGLALTECQRCVC
ncbi:hypothetical protein N5I32_12550 [Acidimangrovimonas sediminis]|uniref:Uncharacterized protein n=1 Tax=Albidovulum sediminis TaxID=3066345 RepID=A0ABT2NSA6_9RHOB|nr:hypothetical protein [Defluviimonas sediminis]